jgi:hypothetical protein
MKMNVILSASKDVYFLQTSKTSLDGETFIGTVDLPVEVEKKWVTKEAGPSSVDNTRFAGPEQGRMAEVLFRVPFISRNYKCVFEVPE